MNINEKITVTFSEKEIEQILKDVLAKKGYEINKTTINADTDYVQPSYGMEGYSTYTFRSIECDLKRIENIVEIKE